MDIYFIFCVIIQCYFYCSRFNPPGSPFCWLLCQFAICVPVCVCVCVCVSVEGFLLTFWHYQVGFCNMASKQSSLNMLTTPSNTPASKSFKVRGPPGLLIQCPPAPPWQRRKLRVRLKHCTQVTQLFNNKAITGTPAFYGSSSFPFFSLVQVALVAHVWTPSLRWRNYVHH